MNNTTVTLHTGSHCIETAAKYELRRLTDVFLQSSADNPDTANQYKLELLLDFLKTADFSALRSSDERLAGITPAICIIRWNSDNDSVVRIMEK